jgi:hypothetical protein
MPTCFDRLCKLSKRSKQLGLPRRPAAASLEAVLGISLQPLADIISGVTDVTAVCTVKIGTLY